jgi:hypothetical protein
VLGDDLSDGIIFAETDAIRKEKAFIQGETLTL